jgi:hypothetical protein
MNKIYLESLNQQSQKLKPIMSIIHNFLCALKVSVTYVDIVAISLCSFESIA